MSGDVARLSEREREVLRFLGHGHDAKSAASTLGLSVHAVNERLREARRKLGVSSSREAARRLLALEGGADKNLVDEKFGVGAGPSEALDRGSQEGPASTTGPSLGPLVVGGVMLTLVIAGMAAMTMNANRPEEGEGTLPRVVSTSPASGDVIAPGPFLLSVTFDRPMRPGNYSFVQKSADTYPDCDGQPDQSSDGRTFILRCTARAGRSYEVWLNSPPYMNFRSVDGDSAQPFQLLFPTRDR